MALRNLVIEGDPLLRKKSRPVDEITPRIIKLLDDLAAPQVGVLRRVFIVDIGDDHGKIEFINPEIIEMSGSQVGSEGCLSVPGKTCEVDRPDHIKVKALDRDGNEFVLEADDLLARCICHENDHLDGILFIDKSVDGKVYRVEEDDDDDEEEE